FIQEPVPSLARPAPSSPGTRPMLRLRLALLASLFTLPLGLAQPPRGIDPTVATPPVAKKVPHKTELHGEALLDDYFWMKDKKNPEVIKHLESENAYTAAVMKPTKPLQEKLYKEMLSRIKQTDRSVPF